MARHAAGLVDQPAETLVTMLLGSGRTVATAESCTAGAIASRVAGVPDASDVLRGDFVAYVAPVKFELLAVTPGPVVIERAAREIARAAWELLHAELGSRPLACSARLKPRASLVGTLWVGVSAGTTWAQHHDLPVRDCCCDPDEAVTAALRVALQFLTNTALVSR